MLFRRWVNPRIMSHSKRHTSIKNIEINLSSMMKSHLKLSLYFGIILFRRWVNSQLCNSMSGCEILSLNVVNYLTYDCPCCPWSNREEYGWTYSIDPQGIYNQIEPKTNSTVKIPGDVIKLTHFPYYWPFVRGIHRLPVDSPPKGQWRGALIFPLICAWTNTWANNRDAGDLRRHCAQYDVTIMCELYCIRSLKLNNSLNSAVILHGI